MIAPSHGYVTDGQVTTFVRPDGTPWLVLEPDAAHEIDIDAAFTRIRELAPNAVMTARLLDSYTCWVVELDRHPTGPLGPTVGRTARRR